MTAGQTVLVIGSGISGLLHVQLARARGAARIIATDISEYRLKAAAQFGADADDSRCCRRTDAAEGIE